MVVIHRGRRGGRGRQGRQGNCPFSKPSTASTSLTASTTWSPSMHRPIAILGAPSSIGIRPYDDGTPRRLDLAPNALRQQRLSERIAARDLGDVLPPTYRDFVRPRGRPRNEDGVARYSRDIAARVAGAAADGAFVLLLGGDCSIVLGGLDGVRRNGAGRGTRSMSMPTPTSRRPSRRAPARRPACASRSRWAVGTRRSHTSAATRPRAR